MDLNTLARILILMSHSQNDIKVDSNNQQIQDTVSKGKLTMLLQNYSSKDLAKLH